MSEKFTLVKNYYDDGFWTKEQVQFAVFQHWITADEFEDITEDIYEEPSNAPKKEKNVIFIDYDGTEVYAYSTNDFLKLASMPPNPTHTGLTAQGWNWDLDDAKEYVREHGILVIGQTYITSDGTTKVTFDFSIFDDESKYGSFDENNYVINIHGSLIGEEGEIEIDWGDGSPKQTVKSDQHYIDAQENLAELQSFESIYEEVYDKSTQTIDNEKLNLYAEQIFKSNVYQRLEQTYYNYYLYTIGGNQTYEEDITSGTQPYELVSHFITNFKTYLEGVSQKVEDLTSSINTRNASRAGSTQQIEDNLSLYESLLQNAQLLLPIYNEFYPNLDENLPQYAEEYFKNSVYIYNVYGYPSYEDYLSDGKESYEDLMVQYNNDPSEFVNMELIQGLPSVIEVLESEKDSLFLDLKQDLYSNYTYEFDNVTETYSENQYQNYFTSHKYNNNEAYVCSIKVKKGKFLPEEEAYFIINNNNVPDMIIAINIGNNFLIDDFTSYSKNTNTIGEQYLEYVCVSEETFSSLPNLKTCTIPNNIEMISYGCFENCYSLQAIVLPKNLINIPQQTLKECYMLKYVSLPKDIPVLGQDCFSNCYSLEILTLPNNIVFSDFVITAQNYSLKKLAMNTKMWEKIKNYYFTRDGYISYNFEHYFSSLENNSFLKYNIY